MRADAGAHGRLRTLPRPQIRSSRSKTIMRLYGVQPLHGTNRSTGRTTSEEDAYLAYEKELKSASTSSIRLSQPNAPSSRIVCEQIRSNTWSPCWTRQNLPNEEFYENSRSGRFESRSSLAMAGLPVSSEQEFHPIFAPWHALAAVPETIR